MYAVQNHSVRHTGTGSSPGPSLTLGGIGLSPWILFVYLKTGIDMLGACEVLVGVRSSGPP